MKNSGRSEITPKGYFHRPFVVMDVAGWIIPIMPLKFYVLEPQS